MTAVGWSTPKIYAIWYNWMDQRKRKHP